MPENRVIISIDNLETSIIFNVPFAVGFLEIILNIKKSPGAPFRAIFLGRIKLKLIRKKVGLAVESPETGCRRHGPDGHR